MSFHEVQFPPGISYGSSGGPGFSTSIVQVDSGAEERISRWNSARRRYDARYGVKSLEELDALRDFYLARFGAAHGFRWKDHADFTSASNHRSAPAFGDEVIGTGDGATESFQLKTRYTSGEIYTVTRNITKPVEGTTVVGLDGVEQASGWSVNNSTGIVTFTTAPGSAVEVTAGCEYDVPVRFGSDLDETLSISRDAFNSGGLSNVPVVEIRDGLEIADEFFYGGAKDHGALAASVSISFGDGRVHRFNPAGAGLAIVLPSEAAAPLGGPHFFLVNSHGSTPMSVNNQAGSTVATLNPGALTIVLGLVDGDRTWLAL